ncbi:hypothetical protein QTG56_25085 (plasmid) [Rossellomorea sp. AcN35-11]|nr:hypothetical protein [Rossellomorea aquimaris]WJV31909.1 hypothetical protein QTG56_25085 [Rossellomorea sp. AcN35-11]
MKKLLGLFLVFSLLLMGCSSNEVTTVKLEDASEEQLLKVAQQTHKKIIEMLKETDEKKFHERKDAIFEEGAEAFEFDPVIKYESSYENESITKFNEAFIYKFRLKESFENISGASGENELDLEFEFVQKDDGSYKISYMKIK